MSGAALIAAFAIIMLLAAVATWRKASDDRHAVDAMRDPACPRLRLGRDLAAGALIGAMTGFFGVGGGFLIVPTLAVFLALSIRLAVGTSLVIITAISLMALAAHLFAGPGLDLALTATMTAGCALGALAGVTLAGRVPERQLGRGFAGLVTAVAAYLLLSVAFPAAQPAPDHRT